MSFEVALETAIDRVNTDLQSSGDTRSVRLARAELDKIGGGGAIKHVPDTATVAVYIDGRLVGAIFVPPQTPAEHATRLIADDLQDFLVGNEIAHAWPACPLHSHQLLPALEGGRAIWRCPGGDIGRVLIGELGASSESRTAPH